MNNKINITSKLIQQKSTYSTTELQKMVDELFETTEIQDALNDLFEHELYNKVKELKKN